MNPLLTVENLHKDFVLHGQGGTALEVMSDLSLELNAGECLVLAGRSGIGKSTLLKMLYRQLLRSNFLCDWKYQTCNRIFRCI